MRSHFSTGYITSVEYINMVTSNKLCCNIKFKSKSSQNRSPHPVFVQIISLTCQGFNWKGVFGQLLSNECQWYWWPNQVKQQLSGLHWTAINRYAFARKVHFWTCDFWPNLALLWPWPFYFSTTKSDQFTFVSSCMSVVNLVKFPQKVCKIWY